VSVPDGATLQQFQPPFHGLVASTNRSAET